MAVLGDSHLFWRVVWVGTTMTPAIVAIVLTLQVSTEPMCLVTVVTAVSVPENKNP